VQCLSVLLCVMIFMYSRYYYFLGTFRNRAVYFYGFIFVIVANKSKKQRSLDCCN
jgi:preprotein translocase subunit SecD